MVWYALADDNMAIYLMRHGAVDAPPDVFYGPDHPLSDMGKQQVVHTLAQMNAARILPVAIVSSPYMRAKQTAEIAAQAFGAIPVSLDDRLREWSVDGWFGKSFADFYAHLGWIDGKIVTDFPEDIESYEHLAARVTSALQDALTTYGASGDILVVSHGEPIGCVAVSLQHQPWRMVQEHQIHLAEVWRCGLTPGDTSAIIEHAFGPDGV